MRLKDKTVLITGATSGIGLASAQRAIEEGAFVIFTARDSNSVVKTQLLLGQKSLGIRCDNTHLADHDILIKILTAQQIYLDVVLLNAGNVYHQAFGEWSEQDFDTVLNTNFKGPFFLLQQLLTRLNPQCSVILTGSTSIHIALEHSSVYAASKIALRSLVKTLSRELLQHQIRFNLLSPGPTLTPALDKVASSNEAKDKLKQQIENLVPIHRLANPKEIADAFIYLASNESKFVVGTELLIDGGVANL